MRPLLTICIAVTLTAVPVHCVCAPSPCASGDRAQRSVVTAGIGLYHLVPSQLPDFEQPTYAYGPRAAIVLIDLSALGLQSSAYIEVSYGSQTDLVLWLTEAGLRFDFAMPYFSGFFSSGIHYLDYTGNQNQYFIIGSNIGLGAHIPIGPKADLSLQTRGYIQKGPPILSFGINFLYQI